MCNRNKKSQTFSQPCTNLPVSHNFRKKSHAINSAGRIHAYHALAVNYEYVNTLIHLYVLTDNNIIRNNNTNSKLLLID